jgi:hypothetical protein
MSDQWPLFEKAMTDIDIPQALRDAIVAIENEPYKPWLSHTCVRCGRPSGPEGHGECFD